MKITKITAVIFGLALIGGCRQGAPSGELISQPAQTPDPFFTILWAGDTLLGDAAQDDLDRYGYSWPFEFISPLLVSDFAIANAEAPITNRSRPWDPDQRWSYNANPLAAAALAEAGFDALGLSNNHAMDRGPRGLRDTRRHLQAHALEPFGGGMYQAQAETPLLVDTPYGMVGVVALSLNWGSDRTAGEYHAGTVVLNEESIQRGYQLAKAAGARWVTAYVYWGQNYTAVDASQHRWAKMFAQAGYHLVVGHGAHVVQSIEIVEGMPVVYSLGNFVFGTPGRFTPEYPGYGLLVISQLGPQGFGSLVIHCIQTDNDIVAYQPRPCTNAQAQEVLGNLHSGVIIQDNTGLLSLAADE